jgi:hypothetical protein
MLKSVSSICMFIKEMLLFQLRYEIKLNDGNTLIFWRTFSPFVVLSVSAANFV